MALRDYVAWHDAYDRPGSGLHLRLLTVQELIASALDEAPPGPVRVISMCAGQGRDLIGVARRHRRGGDLTGLLVEAEPRNVAVAREAIGRAGLSGLTVQEGDAGTPDSYAGAVPADLLLAAGIFGNVSRDDVRRTIQFLPAMCAPGALVIWTRHPEPDGIMQTIENWFTETGFRPQALIVPEGKLFGVGAGRLTAAPAPFRNEEKLFTFTQ